MVQNAERSEYIIEFGPKFCQAQMQNIFASQKSAGAANHWNNSLEPCYEPVIFDLSLTEWIATEQITFLFAWMRCVKKQNKKLIVRLPLRTDLYHKISADRLNEFKSKYKSSTGEHFVDSPIRIKRRKRSSTFLLAVYGLLKRVGLDESDFENKEFYNIYNREAERLSSYTHQIIPFSLFDLTCNVQGIKLDSHFQEVIGSNTDQSSKSESIFELEDSLRTILRTSACYSPIESKILSNVITHELYINALQHAYDQLYPNKECYISAFLAKSWDASDVNRLTDSFTTEKYADSLDFYKDKTKILPKVNEYLLKEKKAVEPRDADLSIYDDFLNQSYLEFSFVDFGQGIANTLQKQFEAADLDRLDQMGYLSKGFEKANLDSKIIEYAMLMDTSKNPLDKTIEHYELVPRGLYFLVDMIRRYKGLIIIRSGRGTVFYDFSDRIFIEKRGNKNHAVPKPCFRIREAVRHIKHQGQDYFPGTLYSIIIPQRVKEDPDDKKEKKKRSTKKVDATIIPAVRSELDALTSYAYSLTRKDFRDIPPYDKFNVKKYRYYSVLFEYNSVIEKLKDEENEVHVKEIYNRLFTSINEALTVYSEESTITFFDFCGLKAGNVSWIKILYFMMISPKINEHQKVVIFNLPGIERLILGSIGENYSVRELLDRKLAYFSEPYLFRPIPCIRFKIDARNSSDLVDWIGVKSENDKATLTELLVDNDSQSAVSLSDLENVDNTEGNMFFKLDDFLHRLDGFDTITKRFIDEQKVTILSFLKKYVVNGKNQKTGEQEFVYITANGGYQYDYLSLYEILHDKYIARYFAKCLLDKYCMEVRTTYKGKAIKNVHKFNKIIAVTVSSQLVAIALRDLIDEDDSYSYFRETGNAGDELTPEVIMLSSYYSFDQEKPFEKIVAGDRVLIVNDVISTGTLVGSLMDKIDNKGAIVAALFSIADTRIPPEGKLKNSEEKEVDCLQLEGNGRYARQFISLVEYDDGKGLVIRKFEGPYRGSAFPKRINPLLNTIVDLKSSHAEKRQLLFPDTERLFEEGRIVSDYFKIGHFQQNLTHNGFLTHMRSLFMKSEGEQLLSEVRRQINKRYKSGDILRGNTPKLEDVEKDIEQIARTLEGDLQTAANEVLQKVIALRIAQSGDGHGGHEESYTPDFIFYPVFSGIEKMKTHTISRLFDTHPDNIIGLQRFDTPKGWRFPFPAKRFNRLTKNKSVMILDSGSLTGESLVQLIDNICFLDVKDILVVSIVSRIEEFYREFYSRLKALKVKRLKSRSKTENIESIDALENVVPIEVLFGINLHIPVYSSSVSCPFCEELNHLNRINAKTHLINDVSWDETQYIIKRLDELKLLNSAKDKLVNVAYLPVEWKTRMADTKNIFLMRDELGKVDSYRFYSDYFNTFNTLLESTLKDDSWMKDPRVDQKIELILACILHEPQLIDLITNYLNGVISVLKKYLLKFALGDLEVQKQLYYEWKPLSLVQVSYTIFANKEKTAFDPIEKPINDLLEIEHFERILSWDDKDCKYFYHFKLFDLLYNRKSTTAQKNTVERLLSEFDRRYRDPGAVGPNKIYLSTANKDFTRILKKYYKRKELGEYLDIPFYNLLKFVSISDSEERHSFLVQRLNDVINSIQSTNPMVESISGYLNQVVTIFDYQLKQDLVRISEVDNLNSACSTLYTFLFKEKVGVLDYIRRTESFYNELKTVANKDTGMVAAKLEELKELCKTMVKDVFNARKEGECFYRLSFRYPVKLAQAIHQMVDKEKCEDFKLEALNPNDDGTIIQFHFDMLEAVLNEIIKNSKEKREVDHNVKLSFKFTHRQNAIHLEIDQNFPFKRPTKNGGGIQSIIEKYVCLFGGSVSDNRDESMVTGKNYVINIVFNKHNYEDQA